MLKDTKLNFDQGKHYFLADIATHFHCGEAIVSSDGNDSSWCCVFTLNNRYIHVIYNLPLESTEIIRIIKKQDIKNLKEYMVSNQENQNQHE